MNNTTQLALFFSVGTIFNPAKISTKIIEKLPEIGDPIILPINTEAPKEANIPFMIFNQNANLQIVSNFNNIILTVKDDSLQKISDIVNLIFDIFKKEELTFRRIGYVPSLFYDKCEISNFKNNYMNSELFSDTIDFQFSWFKKLKFNGININCWERYVTDSTKFEQLLKVYDFNTNEYEDVDIDKKFVKEFMIFCDNYIDNKN